MTQSAPGLPLLMTFRPGNIDRSGGRCYTDPVGFEWDDETAAANLSKHGVSFDEAKTVFNDPLYVDFFDPDHSHDEHRYLIVGGSSGGRLLIVSYAERGEIVRIVSARELTSAEQKEYEEGEYRNG